MNIFTIEYLSERISIKLNNIICEELTNSYKIDNLDTFEQDYELLVKFVVAKLNHSIRADSSSPVKVLNLN